MNYHILLINIVLMCAIYFSCCVVIQLIANTIRNILNSKFIYSNMQSKLLKIGQQQFWFTVLAAFFIALYNYLIMTQL